MRLMITRRSSSLYSKGLIVTDEQDQELGPWFTASSLGGTVAAKRCLFHKNQELNKIQTLRRATAGIYRVLGVTPPGRAP